MVPSVPLILLATPSDLAAPTPPGAFHSLALPKVQSAPAVLLRKLVKLSVVPEESERCTGWIGVDGSFASGLSALIAASSHLVILPAKIFARVAGLSCRLSTPPTLKE